MALRTLPPDFGNLRSADTKDLGRLIEQFRDTVAQANDLFAQIQDVVNNNASLQTGYAVTNPSTSRTLDVSAATLAQVRAVLGTLIDDLKLGKFPSA